VFEEHTRILYQQCWKMHFLSEVLIERMRQKLLKNPFFDISKTFRDLRGQ